MQPPPSANPPTVRHRGPPPQRPARPARPPPPKQDAPAPAGYSNYAPAPAPYYASQPTASTTTNDWYTPSAADSTSMNYNMAPSNYAAPAPYNNTSYPPAHNNNPYPANPPAYFGGTMDTAASGVGAPAYMTPSTFVPAAPQADLQGYNEDDFANEPPLLEELGVNWEHILMKTKAVVIPFRRFQQHSALSDPSLICGDADLAGPLVYALLLGGELLVAGKLQFGSIYGFGLFGCLSMTLILNLMMSATSISFWTVTSILGYSLIPVNLLAALKIVLLGRLFPVIRLCAFLTVLWSTTASTRLLEIGFGLTDQRYLLAYPIALLYSAFVLITIF